MHETLLTQGRSHGFEMYQLRLERVLLGKFSNALLQQDQLLANAVDLELSQGSRIGYLPNELLLNTELVVVHVPSHLGSNLLHAFL